MEYRRFENTIVVRLDRKEEILEKLREVALKENVKLASVSGIGATDDFIVQLYDLNDKSYHPHHFTTPHEIVSLTGNINTMSHEYYAHLHMCCADEEAKAVGGHLTKAVISATGEIFLTVLDGSVDRFHDEETGLNLFCFEEEK